MSVPDKLPLFYRHVAPLDSKKHHSWRLPEAIDYHFAEQSNIVHLSLAEFVAAARYYPIVFSEISGQLLTLAILGLQEKQNLFVTQGAWADHYIPAYVRRYPFILAAIDQGRSYTVCIDTDYFKQQRSGAALFTSSGAQSEFLQEKVVFLKEFEAQAQITLQFAAALQKLDLFEPMHAQINPKGGAQFSLSGFMVVSRKKLNALKSEDLSALAKKGHLEAVYQHLFSLNNFNLLLDKFVAGAK